MAATCEGESGFVVDDDFARDMNIYINSSCAVDRIRDGAACATLLRGVQRYSFFVMLLMMGNGRSLFFGALQHLGKAISDAASFHPPHCTNSVPETLFNYTYIVLRHYLSCQAFGFLFFDFFPAIFSLFNIRIPFPDCHFPVPVQTQTVPHGMAVPDSASRDSALDHDTNKTN